MDRSGTGRRIGLAATAALAMSLLAAQGALGATLSAGGSTLTFEALEGERNTVTVEPLSNGNFRVIDNSAPIVAGAGCTQQQDHRAVCPGAGITLIVINGRDGNDEVRITSGTVDAQIDGGSGVDSLSGAGGDDILIAGSTGLTGGGDLLIGEGGNDTLFGTTRASSGTSLFGGSGNDDLLGGPGSDSLFSDPGADVLRGGGSFDQLDYSSSSAAVSITPGTGADDGAAGEGDNVAADIEGYNGSNQGDTFVGSALGEQVNGGGGDDLLQGGDGNDFLTGGFGVEQDNVRGQAGDDNIDGGAGPDTMSGGPGTDSASFSYHFNALIPFAISLNDVPDDGTAGEGKNVRSDVENVFGTPADDTITGSEAENQLTGSSGADVISGLGADDDLVGDQTFLSGPGGADVLIGGTGDDAMLGGQLGDVLNGQAGFDFANFALGAAGKTVTINDVADDGEPGENDNVRTTTEGVLGGSGADQLTGSSAANVLIGSNGTDQLQGAGGDDYLVGDNESSGTFFADTIGGGNGLDTASYSGTFSALTVTIDDVANDGASGEGDNVFSSVENLIGGFGGDTLTGNGQGNVIVGRPNNDTLNGAGGTDYLAGQEGGDIHNGQNGNDQLNSRLDGSIDTNNCGNDSDALIADSFDTNNADCESISATSPVVVRSGPSLEGTYDQMRRMMRISRDAADRAKESRKRN